MKRINLRYIYRITGTLKQTNNGMTCLRMILTSMAVIVLLIPGTGCSKTEKISGPASLTIVNSLNTPLIVNFNEQDSVIYANGGVNQILYGRTGLEYGMAAGLQRVNLREVNMTTPIPAWSDAALLNARIRLSPGEMWSLFLSGTVDRPDTLLVKDLPLHFLINDSSMGIRFANLSEAGTSVSVNLRGETMGSENAALPYKAVTGFRKYAANVSAPSYFFEFRNSSNGNLLATAVISNPGNIVGNNQWRYRNFTIVYCGSSGSPSSPPSAFIVKNY